VLIAERFFYHAPNAGGDFIRGLCIRRLAKGTDAETSLAKHAVDTGIPVGYRHLPVPGLLRRGSR
jgi:hypothetical protein